jgi:hypothetical protein
MGLLRSAGLRSGLPGVGKTLASGPSALSLLHLKMERRFRRALQARGEIKK